MAKKSASRTISIPPGTVLRLDGGATIITEGSGDDGGDQQHQDQAVRVKHTRSDGQKFDEMVSPGDYDRLGEIFRHSGGTFARLDDSERQGSWEEQIEQYRRKFGDDNISRKR